MTQNNWQARYGARRRQIDRALLAEAERALGAFPEPQTPKITERPSALDQDAHARIAQAFGRASG
jgi:hypothetical protein